jgi:hypothetical protein
VLVFEHICMLGLLRIKDMLRLAQYLLFLYKSAIPFEQGFCAEDALLLHFLFNFEK